MAFGYTGAAVPTPSGTMGTGDARTATGSSVVSSLAVGALLSLLVALTILGKRFKQVTLPQLVPGHEPTDELADGDGESEQTTEYQPFVDPRA